jgi:hypothetical protein
MNVNNQAIWLQHFLTELGVHFHHLIVILCDNKISSVIQFPVKPRNHLTQNHNSMHVSI